MSRRLRAINAVVIVAAASLHMATAYGQAHDRLRGGITLRSRAPLYDNSLSYPTGRTQLLRRHKTEANLALSHVNTWAQMPGYFFDGEWSRLELRLAYGLTPRTEMAVHLMILGQWGGVMDGAIEGFHSLMHITQARRNLYPRNTLRVTTQAHGTALEALGPKHAGAGLLGPVLVLRHGLANARVGPQLAVEAHLQVPAPPTVLGGHGQTAGPQGLLALSAQHFFLERLEIFGAGGIMVRPRAKIVYGMPLSSVGKFVLLGLNVRVRSNVRLAAHYLSQDGLVEAAQFWPMHLSTHEFVLGVKWAPRSLAGWMFECGVIENSIHDANTPDFGLTLATGFATG